MTVSAPCPAASRERHRTPSTTVSFSPVPGGGMGAARSSVRRAAIAITRSSKRAPVKRTRQPISRAFLRNRAPGRGRFYGDVEAGPLGTAGPGTARAFQAGRLGPSGPERRKSMLNRFRRLLGTLAILVFVTAVSGCKTTSSPGRQIDDAGIKTAVKAKLAADVKLSTLTNIEVNSTNGVVTLAGQVNDESDRIQAERVTRTVDGVVRVNNELQVKNR